MTSPILNRQEEDLIVLPDFRHQLDPSLDGDLLHNFDETGLDLLYELDDQLDPNLRQPVNPIVNTGLVASPQGSTPEASSRLTNPRASFKFFFLNL